MSSKTIGLILVIVGILGALFFALADVIGIGDQNRFGYQQIAGTVVGVIIFAIGIVMYMRQRPA